MFELIYGGVTVLNMIIMMVMHFAFDDAGMIYVGIYTLISAMLWCSEHIVNAIKMGRIDD